MYYETYALLKAMICLLKIQKLKFCNFEVDEEMKKLSLMYIDEEIKDLEVALKNV